MRRHIAKPFDAGRLEWDVGIEAAGDGLVDDGLLALGEELDETVFVGDVSLDTGVGAVQVADDGGLLGEGRVRVRLSLDTKDSGTRCCPAEPVIETAANAF